MSYIEIRGLSKRFGDTQVLDNLSLDIEKGDVVAVIGPSGTGKSTLLRSLNLLETPESGFLKIGEKEYNLTCRSGSDRRKIRLETEMVFQQFNLLKNRNTLENVTEGLITVKGLSKAEAERRALLELDRVGMSDRLFHYPRHLSGGQQQRVAIARALAMDPELLLLDEPTSALDPELVGEVLTAIKKVAAAGNTILLVTHEMNFVRNAATKVVFLEHGKVEAQGTPKEIFENADNPRLKQFLYKINFLDLVDYYI